MGSFFHNGGQEQNVTTFYVGNLPGEISKSLLWKAFQPHGLVKDAYVAKKRDARGNFFGFVRIQGVVNMDKTLEGMNTVTIYEARLKVFPAKFGKGNKRFDQHSNHQAYTKKYVPLTTKNQQQTGNHPGQAYVRKGVSFKESLAGPSTKNNEVHAENNNGKSMVYEGRAAIYPNHCMMRSVVVEALNLEAIKKMRNALDEDGYKESAISYIGGLKFLLIFKEKKEALQFIRGKEKMWKQFFTSATLWEGQDVGWERLVWIRITGGPLQLRDGKFYNTIAGLYGRLVVESNFSWESPKNHEAMCGIVSESGKRIEEAVQVQWEDQTYGVWVSEVSEVSVDQVLENLVSGDESENSETEESMESVAGENEDLEDGEIGPEYSKPPEVHVGEREAK
ncbi:putative RNA recognition motif domain, nucleotide-binding alpha-beta plait domain superfamily [Helianthus annuus]|nr:putative RNA recognition motif domain, nucleotide-binding alpha-beta plait domain superfamily [Helianthus annuus]